MKIHSKIYFEDQSLKLVHEVLEVPDFFPSYI